MTQLVAAEGPILEAILSETHAIWHDRLPRDAYGRWWGAQLKTPWGRQHLRRLALVDGRTVLASVKVYDFDAVLDGRRVGVCGLGAVFTQVEQRGHGQARALIEQVLAAPAAAASSSRCCSRRSASITMRASGSPSCPRTTRPSGWRRPPGAVRRRCSSAPVTIATTTRWSPSAARRRSRSGSTSIVTVGSSSMRSSSNGCGRGWRRAPRGTRELQFFVAEEGASAAAFVVLAVEGDTWTILECGDRDPTGARIGGLLQALIARTPTPDPPTVVGRLPAGVVPPQLTVVGHHPARELMMIRAIGGGAAAPALDARDVLYWRSDLF